MSQQLENEMNIPVNREAPVIADHRIEIPAPVEKVWEVLTRIDEWPRWQKSVSKSTLRGKLAEGTSFRWKADGLVIDSNIHTLKPNKMIGWTGRTIGANAVHNWVFEAKGDATIVEVEESLQGVLPKLFRGYFKKKLDRGMQINLEELKAAAVSA